MSPGLIYITAIVLLAGFIQGFSGFGFMLITLPLLSFILEIKVCVPLMILLALLVNTFLITQLKQHLSPSKFLPLLLSAIPGIFAGVIILDLFPEQALKALLGIILILASLQALLFKPSSRELKSFWKYVAGFISGCLGGSLGTAGPPIIMYMSRQPWSKETIKSSLIGYFILLGLGTITIQAMHGLVTPRVTHLFLLCLVPLALGVYLGQILFKKVKDIHFWYFMQFFLMLLGISLLLKIIYAYIGSLL